MINIQSTLPKAPELCKNFSLTVLSGNDGNSYKTSTQLDMSIYIYTLGNIDRLDEQKKWGQQWMLGAKEIFFASHRLGSHGLVRLVTG